MYLHLDCTENLIIPSHHEAHLLFYMGFVDTRGRYRENKKQALEPKDQTFR